MLDGSLVHGDLTPPQVEVLEAAEALRGESMSTSAEELAALLRTIDFGGHLSEKEALILANGLSLTTLHIVRRSATTPMDQRGRRPGSPISSAILSGMCEETLGGPERATSLVGRPDVLLERRKDPTLFSPE